MPNPELVDRVLEAHEISIVITGRWGQTTRLRVSIPDLRGAPRRAWGDWGPMYTVSIPPDRAIEISVDAPFASAPRVEALDLSKLEIDSPMAGALRDLTPLVMKLPLLKQRLHLHVYYDPRGRPTKAKLVPMTSAVGRRALVDAAIVTGSESSASGGALRIHPGTEHARHAAE